MQEKVIFLVSKEKAGDDINAAATARAYFGKLEDQSIAIEEVDTREEKNIEQLIANLNKNHKLIIFAAGSHQLVNLKKFEKVAPKVATWLSHQPCVEMKEAPAYVDYFAIPGCLANENNFTAKGLDYQKFQPKILPLDLVPHDKSREKIAEEHNKFVTRGGVLHNKYITILLGGDAPDHAGKILPFTAERAVSIANEVFKIAKQEDRFIYISNGPRTNDAVTSAFIKRLNELGLNEDKYRVFDFKSFNAGVIIPNLQNTVSALYHHAVANDGRLFIPGESTSILSEVLGLFEGMLNKIHIYETDSMNQDHKTFLDHLRKSHLVVNPVQQVAAFILREVSHKDQLLTSTSYPINDIGVQIDFGQVKIWELSKGVNNGVAK